MDVPGAVETIVDLIPESEQEAVRESLTELGEGRVNQLDWLRENCYRTRVGDGIALCMRTRAEGVPLVGDTAVGAVTFLLGENMRRRYERSAEKLEAVR